MEVVDDIKRSFFFSGNISHWIHLVSTKNNTQLLSSLLQCSCSLFHLREREVETRDTYPITSHLTLGSIYCPLCVLAHSMYLHSVFATLWLCIPSYSINHYIKYASQSFSGLPGYHPRVPPCPKNARRHIIPYIQKLGMGEGPASQK